MTDLLTLLTLSHQQCWPYLVDISSMKNYKNDWFHILVGPVYNYIVHTFFEFGQVSSVEIERICNATDTSILETAAIGVPPPGGGPERLVIAVVFKDSSDSTQDLDKLRTSFNSGLQKKLNPFFKVLSTRQMAIDSLKFYARTLYS